jgi:hypothetical protein
MRPTTPPLLLLLALTLPAPAWSRPAKTAKTAKTSRATKTPKAARASKAAAAAAMRRIELISGEWTEVAQDAKPGRVTMAGCFPAYRSYTVLVDGASVQVRGHQVAWGAQPPPWGPVLEGPLREVGFDAEGKNPYPPPGTPETWSVSYDEATEHLVGTRNGKPLRLARLRIEPPNGPCKNGPP